MLPKTCLYLMVVRGVIDQIESSSMSKVKHGCKYVCHSQIDYCNWATLVYFPFSDFGAFM